MTEYTTISIPKKLAEKVKERIKNTGFSSLSEFTKFVLRDIVVYEDVKDECSDGYARKIRERLRKLGYLK